MELGRSMKMGSTSSFAFIFCPPFFAGDFTCLDFAERTSRILGDARRSGRGCNAEPFLAHHRAHRPRRVGWDRGEMQRCLQRATQFAGAAHATLLWRGFRFKIIIIVEHQGKIADFSPGELGLFPPGLGLIQLGRVGSLVDEHVGSLEQLDRCIVTI